MKRRTLLGTVGATTVGMAGCIGSRLGLDEQNNPDPELPDGVDAVECPRDYVQYSLLPDEVVPEVDTALETGSYETEGAVLYEYAVKDTAKLSRRNTYYNHQIQEEGGTRVLTFEETVPTHSSPIELIFVNTTDTEREASVTVQDDETTLVDTDVYVDPGARVDNPSRDGKPTVPVTEVFGRYDMVIDLDDGETSNVPLLVNEDGDMWIFIRDNGISIQSQTDAPSGGNNCRGRGGWWGGH